MSFAGKWMELGINEISQTQKEKNVTCFLLDVESRFTDTM